ISGCIVANSCASYCVGGGVWCTTASRRVVCRHRLKPASSVRHTPAKGSLSILVILQISVVFTAWLVVLLWLLTILISLIALFTILHLTPPASRRLDGMCQLVKIAPSGFLMRCLHDLLAHAVLLGHATVDDVPLERNRHSARHLRSRRDQMFSSNAAVLAMIRSVPCRTFYN
ncbi:hypothetical protein COOONC_24208, partial [Cooperia oncophora]